MAIYNNRLPFVWHKEPEELDNYNNVVNCFSETFNIIADK